MGTRALALLLSVCLVLSCATPTWATEISPGTSGKPAPAHLAISHPNLGPAISMLIQGWKVSTLDAEPGLPPEQILELGKAASAPSQDTRAIAARLVSALLTTPQLIVDQRAALSQIIGAQNLETILKAGERLRKASRADQRTLAALEGLGVQASQGRVILEEDLSRLKLFFDAAHDSSQLPPVNETAGILVLGQESSGIAPLLPPTARGGARESIARSIIGQKPGSATLQGVAASPRSQGLLRAAQAAGALAALGALWAWGPLALSAVLGAKLLPWAGFGAVVFSLLAADLFVFNRDSHEVKIREALTWTGVWVAVALAFNSGIWFWQGRKPALEFLSAYLVEKSLSVDNLFVFLSLFNTFKVPARYQHRLLSWGIFGAMALRLAIIAAGVTLIQKFHVLLYLLGAFLIITALRMFFAKEEEGNIEDSHILKFLRRWLPVTQGYDGGKFFSKQEARWLATPLFMALLAVEFFDLLFAMDSIPAVLGISSDPFIVYTSNIFAIMGLRALYFAVAGLMPHFHHLKTGLAFILGFVGVKMLIAPWIATPVSLSLGLIAGAIALSLLASRLWPLTE